MSNPTVTVTLDSARCYDRSGMWNSTIKSTVTMNKKVKSHKSLCLFIYLVFYIMPSTFVLVILL